MLSNAYFVAKFRFDTAENEPAKILQNFRKMHFSKMHFRNRSGSACRGFRWDPQFSWDPMNNNMRACAFCACEGREMEMRIDKYQSSAFEVLARRAALRGVGQTLQGSFSAVSKPNFASKYAFESSRRDLHNALLCTAL